eukprot:1183119-Prorocentrum_minimum.AAC.2
MAACFSPVLKAEQVRTLRYTTPPEARILAALAGSHPTVHNLYGLRGSYLRGGILYGDWFGKYNFDHFLKPNFRQQNHCNSVEHCDRCHRQGHKANT